MMIFMRLKVCVFREGQGGLPVPLKGVQVGFQEEGRRRGGGGYAPEFNTDELIYRKLRL